MKLVDYLLLISLCSLAGILISIIPQEALKWVADLLAGMLIGVLYSFVFDGE